MLPGVEEYFNAVLRAEEKYSQEMTELESQPSKYTVEWYQKVDAACQRRDRATTAARRKLQQNVNHPIVQWMVNHREIVQSPYLWEHAEEVLKILPATVDEIQALAASKSWCSTWDRLRDKALADGVLNDFVVLLYQQNNGPWRKLQRHIRMSDGKELNREEIMTWFERGAKSFQFDIRRSTYRFKLEYVKPLQ